MNVGIDVILLSMFFHFICMSFGIPVCHTRPFLRPSNWSVCPTLWLVVWLSVRLSPYSYIHLTSTLHCTARHSESSCYAHTLLVGRYSINKLVLNINIYSRAHVQSKNNTNCLYNKGGSNDAKERGNQYI